MQRFPAKGTAAAELRIHGSTDIEVFATVITDYQRLHPGTEIVYEDVITQICTPSTCASATAPPARTC